MLDEARNGTLKLLQLEPARGGVGLATLLLEARVEGAVSEAGIVDDMSSRRLFQWLPNRVTLLKPRHGLAYPRGQVGDADAVAVIQQPGSIVILSESNCALLHRAGVQLEAVYPQEGTLVLDYPAILSTETTGETRELSARLVRFLMSPKAQRIKEHSGLEAPCAEGRAPKIIAPSSPEVVQALLSSWEASAGARR